MIITGNDPKSIEQYKVFLNSQFKIKDLGKLKYFLGIEVARSSKGISISQRKYTLDLLDEVGLLGAAPVSTPVRQNLKLLPTQGELLKDPSKYRRLIGNLIYLTISRLDIQYPVHHLSQFLSQPRKPHYEAAIHILKYLKGSPGQGLFFSEQNDFKLTAYCDADWGGCQTTRRSVIGYCVSIGKSLISWKMKKQTTVSRSSVEAEYREMVAVTCELHG